MLHGVMRQGSYDANIRSLAPGGTTYVDGAATVPLPEWPPEVDGIRFGALERRRRLLVCRLGFADLDVVLHQPLVLDPIRHLGGGGSRAGERVAVLDDEHAEVLLDDVLAANPGQTNAIALVVNRVNQVRRTLREALARAAGAAEQVPGAGESG
jgi:hypothetical protein